MISNTLFYQGILLLTVVAQHVESAQPGIHSDALQMCNALNSVEILPTPARIAQTSLPSPFSVEHFSRYMAGSPQKCEAGIRVFQQVANENPFIRQQLTLLLRHPRFQISFDTTGQDPNIEAVTFAQNDRFVLHMDPLNPMSAQTLAHEATHLILAFIQNHFFDHKVFPISIRNPDIQKIYLHSSLKADFNQLRLTWQNNLKTLTLAVQHERDAKLLTKKSKALLSGFRNAMKYDPPENTIEILLTESHAKKFVNGKSYPVHLIDISRMLSNTSDDQFTFLSKRKSPIGLGYIARVAIDDPLLAFIIDQHIHLKQIAHYPVEAQPAEFIAHACENKSSGCIRFLYPTLLEPLEEYMNTLLTEYPEDLDNAQEDPNAYLYKLPYYVPDFMSRSKHKINEGYHLIIDIVRKQKQATREELDSGMSVIGQIIQSNDKYDADKSEAKDRLILAELLFLKGQFKLALHEYKKAYKLSKESFDEFPNAAAHYEKTSQVINRQHAPGNIQRRIASMSASRY